MHLLKVGGVLSERVGPAAGVVPASVELVQVTVMGKPLMVPLDVTFPLLTAMKPVLGGPMPSSVSPAANAVVTARLISAVAGVTVKESSPGKP